MIISFEEPSFALSSEWFLVSAVMGRAKEGNKAEILPLSKHELFMSQDPLNTSCQILPKEGFWSRLKYLDTQDQKLSFHFAIKIH